MIVTLRILLSAIWLFMVYVVISTSLESSLFKEWEYLGSIPWMRATLWDFYANILIIYLWVIYRERNIIVKLLWALLFFALGSIGSIGYVLVQLFNMRSNDNISILLQSKHSAK